MFIDIVHCYYICHARSFYIDFGCHPRGVKIKNNFKSWDSMFRGRVWTVENMALEIKLLDSTEELLDSLKDSIPVIMKCLDSWFSNFVDINSAIYALENNNFYENSRHVFLGSKDSPIYKNAMDELLRLNSRSEF